MTNLITITNNAGLSDLDAMLYVGTVIEANHGLKVSQLPATPDNPSVLVYASVNGSKRHFTLEVAHASD